MGFGCPRVKGPSTSRLFQKQEWGKSSPNFQVYLPGRSGLFSASSTNSTTGTSKMMVSKMKVFSFTIFKFQRSACHENSPLKQADFPGDFPTSLVGVKHLQLQRKDLSIRPHLLKFEGWKLATKWRGCVNTQKVKVKNGEKFLGGLIE